MFMHDGSEYRGPLAAIGETVPPDEIIKLQCLEFASRKTEGGFILDVAKEMYAWVKECWIVKDKGATEITIEKNGETITIPLREFEVHA